MVRKKRAPGCHPGLGILVFLCVPGCIKAPDVVLLDHKTALEQQAAGEFRALENDLRQAGISPRGEDFTREQLEAGQADLGQSTLGEIVQIYSAVQTDAQWIDRTLVAGCIAEALDGTLQPTPDQCTQDVDTAEMARVLGRTNLHRRQIWRIIKQNKPDANDEQIREVWRNIHLKRVVCGGLVQVGPSNWERKKC